MIKQFLNSTSLLALAAYAPDGDGEKSEIEKAREAIQVETSKATEQEETDGEGDDTTNNEEDNEGDGEGEGDEEEADEENEEEELTDEQKAEAKAKAKSDTEAKEQRSKDRIQKRIDKAIAEKKAAEKRAEEAEAKLAAKPDGEKPGLTEDDVKREAQKLRAQEAFDNACKKLADGATAIDKDFATKIEAAASDAGPIPGDMIGMLEDLPNGGEVLAKIADDVDEYERIVTLPKGKMAIALVKLSDKLVAEKKPKPKGISKVKEIERVNSGGRSTNTPLSDKDPMDDWVKKRNKQIEERRATRGH